MGLLDDAIREHLELKRLRGADPGLVSREEQEAFGSVHGGESVDTQDAVSMQDHPIGDDAPSTEHNPAQPDDFPHAGQETAELDMRTVLENESTRDVAPNPPSATAPVRATPLTDSASQAKQGSDSLEWEMPGEESSQRSAGRLASDAPGDPTEEEVEDVLEETPDFLRDTPEQERLWFEQRPPRDFDFDD